MKKLKFYPFDHLRLYNIGYPTHKNGIEIDPKIYHTSPALGLLGDFDNIYEYKNNSRINHIKLHGALNMVFISGDLLKTADGYDQGYPYSQSSYPYYCPNFTYTNFQAGIEPSLIFGMDKPVKLFEEFYLSQQTLYSYKCLDSKNPLLSIGYSGGDAHINAFLGHKKLFQSSFNESNPNIIFKHPFQIDYSLSRLMNDELTYSPHLFEILNKQLKEENKLFEKFIPGLADQIKNLN